ncbi:hypothetical protein GCM10009551_053730 [Nocardiopsis tropica]|uniref:hypothetical protein n=1 Tax=Tsukamurella strandjordii TaxID=147577 RepID=UPI0031DA0522
MDTNSSTSERRSGTYALSVFSIALSAALLSGCDLGPQLNKSESSGDSDAATIKVVEDRLGVKIPNEGAVKIVSTSRSSIAMTAQDEAYAVTIAGADGAIGDFVERVSSGSKRVSVASRCSRGPSPSPVAAEMISADLDARSIVSNLDAENLIERCSPIDILFLPDSTKGSGASIYHQGAKAIITAHIGD